MGPAGTAPEPFHRGEGSEGSERRIILVSWEFPPRETAGSLRWEKFSHFLHHAGYALDVVTGPPGDLDGPARLRLSALPPSIRLFAVPERVGWLNRMEERATRGRGPAARPSGAGAPARGSGGPPATPPRPDSLPPDEIRWLPREPRDLLRAFRAAANHQQRTGWGRDAGALALRLVGGRTVAMVTCGPPHGGHLAGWAARRAGIPHILDYRDPWSLPRRMNEPYASPVAFWLAHRSEARLLRSAALVVTNTDPVRTGMQRTHKGARVPMVTVYNGYDEEELPEAAPADFRVLYAGTIYLDRDPRVLFRGAAMAIRDAGAAPHQFRLQLIGAVDSLDGIDVRDLAAAEGLEAHLEIRGRIPRAELKQELANASVLVSLPQDSPWAIPSKVFEYMSYPAAMLVYAAEGSPTAELLRGTGADVLDPLDVDGTRRVLMRRFEEFRSGAGRRPTPVGSRFSRAHQAARLIEEIERCIAGGPPAAHTPAHTR